ncbi:MAG: hypothetical protein AAFQ98_06320 [Bacteroidota bacterium]
MKPTQKPLAGNSLWVLLLLLGTQCTTPNANAPETEEIDGLPVDLALNAPTGVAADFAWNVFLGISAPNAAGIPQWEGYKEAYDIFLPNAATPTGWGQPTPKENHPCGALGGTKILQTTTKVSPVVNETDQAVGGVLIDQESNLVHYEVYMNRPMFEYVAQNELYNAVKQAGTQVAFPMGSMELKASWRILDPTDTALVKRYHTAEAIIYIPDSAHVEAQDCLPEAVKDKMEVCSKQLVGLLGLHIVYKTPSNPSFTWMTFEQVDNVEGPNPALRNPNRSNHTCPDNTRQCNCPSQVTSQISRQTPIPDWVQKSNQTWQDSLRSAKSRWQYYQLIGIQWARDSSRLGDPLLTNLANVSMETFNQTGSSCIGCHAFARSSNPTQLSDFSWVMGRAQNPYPMPMVKLLDRGDPGQKIIPVAGPTGVPLPAANPKALLAYIMRENPYQTWGTWPNSAYYTYDRYNVGENPHGYTTRIYVNEVGLAYYQELQATYDTAQIAERIREGLVSLPPGTVVLKENYRTKQSDLTPERKYVPTIPTPSDLVEITVMYKAEHNGSPEWYWMKTRPYGPPEVAGFQAMGCSSCHSNWEGNGDGMLSFNFGLRPIINDATFGPSSAVILEDPTLDIPAIKAWLASQNAEPRP